MTFSRSIFIMDARVKPAHDTVRIGGYVLTLPPSTFSVCPVGRINYGRK